MSISYRRGSLDDLRSTYDVFVATTRDLEERMGTPPERNQWIHPDSVEAYWLRRRPVFEHIVRTSAQFWIAERIGHPIGYARATNHNGVLELTEFFVHPAEQSAGIGRELLTRTFSADLSPRRFLLGTTDIRALTRYLKSGVYPRFPVYYIYRKPEPVPVETDLISREAGASPETLAALAAIDRVILGFTREEDHAFLLTSRNARLFYRDDRLAGYGYFDNGTGPIALLDENDFPAVLARAESEAAARGDDEFGLQLPLINRRALDHLLGRRFQFDDFTTFVFMDEPFGRFENYVLTSPPFFI